MVFIYAFQKLPLHLHYMSFFSLSPFFDFKYYNAYLQALPVNLFFFFSHVFASFFGGGEQMHGFCNYQDVLTVSMLS